MGESVRTVFTSSKRFDMDCFLPFSMCLGDGAHKVFFIRFDDFRLLQALVQHSYDYVFVRLVFADSVLAVNGLDLDPGAWDGEEELVVTGCGENAKAVLRLRLFWYGETDTVFDIVVLYAEFSFPCEGIRASNCTDFRTVADFELQFLALGNGEGDVGDGVICIGCRFIVTGTFEQGMLVNGSV